MNLYKLLLTLFILLLLITEFLHPITAFTQDLGRHLLMGKIILQTYTIPQTNLLSYTYPNFPFINTHWLSEVVFYIVQQLFGSNGLLLITTSVVVTAFGLIFFNAFSSPRHSGDSERSVEDSRIGFWTSQNDKLFAATVVSILYLRILFERTDIRPELLSFLFLSIFVVILYRYREKYTKWIFILPLLEFLWVNIHIYFPIGIAVIGLFLIDEVINSFYKRNAGDASEGFPTARTRSHHEVARLAEHWREKRVAGPVLLFLILLISCLAILLNPNGINGALYPLHIFQNYGYQIEENQTVFFLWNYFGGKTTILYFFISATLLFLTLLLTIKKSRPIDWLLATFFTYLAANAERNLPLFVFGTFIPFTYSLSALFSFVKVRPSRRSHLLQHCITLILLAIILWNINDVMHLKSFGIGTALGAERGADFFLENNLHGPLFNNFDIGSYLDYRLYPKEKVFIDGRPEAYPAPFIQQVYIPMQSDQKVFNEQDRRHHFNTIFLSHTDMTPWAQTFLKWIATDKQWQIIYLDDYVIILVKNTPENAALIKKYGMEQTTLRINNLEQADKISLLRLANFFRVVGWQNQEEKIYQQLLIIDPTNCSALYNMTTTLSQHNDPTATIYTQRFQQSCQ